MALRDSLRSVETCPQLGVDQKSRAAGQTGAIDPEQTSHEVNRFWGICDRGAF